MGQVQNPLSQIREPLTDRGLNIKKMQKIYKVNK